MKDVLRTLRGRQDRREVHQVHILKAYIHSVRAHPMIDDGYLVSSLDEHVHHMRPDKTAASGDNHFGHGVTP